MTDRPAPTEGQDAALAVAVWDRPVRLVHWLLAALIFFSWGSAEWGHVQWHLWSGYAILFLLTFRILWGFLGSSTARFGGFVRGPAAVANYLRDSGGWRSVGHTPLGALSVLALLGLIAVQVGLGLFLIDEDGDWAGPLNKFVNFETGERAHDLHEALFNVLLGFIVLHVAAIIFYRVVKGKRLVAGMIGGKSHDYPAGATAMIPAAASRLLLSLTVAAAFTGWIISGAPPF
jgi:cytochrome b